MADINAELKTALNGKMPQHKIKGQSAFEPSEGSDGALHTKIVDVSGNPVSAISTSNAIAEQLLNEIQADLESGNTNTSSILTRLNEIKTHLTTGVTGVADTNVLVKLTELETELQAINTRLNETLDTQVTGSIVELANKLNLTVTAGATVKLANNIDLNNDFKQVFSASVEINSKSHNHDILTRYMLEDIIVIQLTDNKVGASNNTPYREIAGTHMTTLIRNNDVEDHIYNGITWGVK